VEGIRDRRKEKGREGEKLGRVGPHMIVAPFFWPKRVCMYN